MADTTPHQHHRIDYIEFVVTDMEAAKAFFAAAFGWSFTDYAPTYAGIQGDGKEQGGITVGDPGTGGPLVVLYSADLEASFAAVEGTGATITKPIFSFPGGRRFECVIPGGSPIAVWSS